MPQPLVGVQPLASPETGLAIQSLFHQKETPYMNPKGIDPDPPVIVISHRPDFDDLSAGTSGRIKLYAEDPPEAFYLNPMFSVICTIPTAEFYIQVHQCRRRWCGQLKLQINRKLYSSVREWTQFGPSMDRSKRYFDYALSVTGVTFIDGKLVTKTKRPLKKGGEHRSRKRPAGASTPVAL